jgi:hypothetical protein
MSDDIQSNLLLQLNELEMLVSMYPGDKELHLSNPALLQDMQEYLDGAVRSVPSVEFSLNVDVDGDVIETIIKLSSQYPQSALPEVYLRSSKFSRSEQSRINADMLTALETESIPEEPCILFLLDWIQTNASQYLFSSKNKNQSEDTVSDSTSTNSSGVFSRYWIYSHHIYSKIKRRDMLDMSKEFELTGFVLPGKPGIICIEGDSKNTAEWWSIVKNWQWKRLSLKIQEDQECNDVSSMRKFVGFQEIGEVKGNTRDYHMDLGAFQSYLTQHGFQQSVFQELFSISK